MEHCIAKIQKIVAQPIPDNRALFQLGFNLGRLSEITGLGRGHFWDDWKTAIDAWDIEKMQLLARNLPAVCAHSSSNTIFRASSTA